MSLLQPEDRRRPPLLDLSATPETTAAELRGARFSTWMDNLQSRAVNATQTLNDLTGYSSIERIKAQNIDLENSLHTAQHRLREARHNYKSLTTHRASTQREVTTLLARKDTWNPLDLERFTTLYRADHELEAQVAEAASELTEAETTESKLSGELNQGILKRYHEEQIWSDRIRRQSTWGTWGLMGVNIILFLVLQFVAEPWRRKRLMKGIAQREEGMFDEVKRELGEVRAALEASGLRERAAAEAAAAAKVAEEEEQSETSPFVEGQDQEGAGAPAPFEEEEPEEVEKKPWKELLQEYWEDPELLKEAVNDLYSERRIAMKMRDVSIIALEGAAAGAAAGAAVAVVLAFSILRS
ncbi:sensitivity to high expression protein she9 [Collariella sp. IMI 366227]|nr:sensitivity to high expression protein she9 [Collariella sp. IMI 366227]